MLKFIKHNKVITACFVVSFVIISLYIFSLNETEWFPHAGDWFNVLFQLSIGFVINFFFYVTQVYIPRQNLSQQANRCIHERIKNVIRRMDEIFRDIVEKYDVHYDECCITKEEILEVFHKMKTHDRINVVAASRSSFLGVNDNAYFTVKEWILSRKEFIEHEIDCIFKFYSQFITPELMEVLEDILESSMHKHLAGVILQSSNNISFEGCDVDEFFYPYFKLMKKLEALKEQYR